MVTLTQTHGSFVSIERWGGTAQELHLIGLFTPTRSHYEVILLEPPFVAGRGGAGLVGGYSEVCASTPGDKRAALNGTAGLAAGSLSAGSAVQAPPAPQRFTWTGHFINIKTG